MSKEEAFFTSDGEARLAEDQLNLEELEKTRKGTEEETEELSEPDTDMDADAPAVPKNEDNWKKRYGDLLSWVDKELKPKHEDKVNELEAALSTARTENTPMPKSVEEVTVWAEQHPDLFGVFRTLILTEVKDQQKDLQKLRKEVQKTQAVTERDKAELKLKKVHPDLDTMREDPEFHDWVAAQDEFTRDLLYKNSTNWGAVSKILTAYKAETNKLEKKRGRPKKEDAAQEVRTNSQKEMQAKTKGSFSESQVRDMSLEDFAKHEKDIFRAQRNGTFEYDISGAAR